MCPYSCRLVSAFTPSQTIGSLTDPFVPGSPFSGTETGFTDGDAELSFNGVLTEITIAAGAFSGIVPMLADNIAYPVLSATGLTVTLTQGVNTASILRSVSLPTGYEVTRDGSNNPVNFSGLVTGDSTYLAYPFEQAGNPLTEADRAYFRTTRNLRIYPNGEVAADAGDGPFTETIFIHRNSGNIYSHDITISESGQLVSIGVIAAVAITVEAITAQAISAIAV